jgi:tetratricopeptide (TPR) repeat protein
MASTARNKPGTERITVEDNNALETLQVKYEKNKKPINTAITVILLAVVGFFAYQNLYKAPRDRKAATAISYAQHYYEVDSFQRALNGDGQHQGFLNIIKKYSGTSSENISHYYAGMCYLNLGDFKNAIKHLEDFDGNGSAIEPAALGCLADAYMETGNTAKGIEYYKKASGDAKNTVFTPLYLYRMAVAYEMTNKKEEAINAYKRIRDEYPQSNQARETDMSLARLGVLD